MLYFMFFVCLKSVFLNNFSVNVSIANMLTINTIRNRMGQGNPRTQVAFINFPTAATLTQICSQPELSAIKRAKERKTFYCFCFLTAKLLMQRKHWPAIAMKMEMTKKGLQKLIEKSN